MPHSYPFMPLSQRAQCVGVVDGDTADLFLDLGQRHYSLERYRLLGIDTHELRSTDEGLRQAALQAKEVMAQWCAPTTKNAINLDVWPLRVVTQRSPDSFGRWLVDLYWRGDDGVEHHANAELLAKGLAVPFRR